MKCIADKMTEVEKERHIKGKLRYYIWIWNLISKGKSLLTADMRWLKL